MSVRSIFGIGLLSVLVAAGSSGALAAGIDFEDVSPAAFNVGDSFTTAVGGITFNVFVNSGGAIVDTGNGTVLTASGLGASQYSDSASKALYVFGSGSVTFNASAPAGHILDVASFGAAIASFDTVFGPNTLGTNVVVTGSVNPHFVGGLITAEFPLDSSTNTSFTTQSLPGSFKHLDWVSFAFHSSGSPGVCDSGCSDNFALDNIAVTAYDCGPACTNPLPPGPPVPEPSTVALWSAGLVALILRRRRKQLCAP
jgi:hypothetical protein